MAARSEWSRLNATDRGAAASASLIAALTTVALVLVLRFDLGLPVIAVLYTVAFNILIVVVKFVGLAGLYEVNIDLGHDLSSELGARRRLPSPDCSCSRCT